VTSLTVSGNTNLSVGQNSQLAAIAHFSDGSSQNVTSAATWSSATPSVATVLGGLVHGVAPGAAPITASYGGQNATATVNVSGSTGPVVNSLSVTGTSPMTVGQQAQYTATANMSDGSSPNVTAQSQWASSNPAVATVDANGVVTAVAPGTTTITASYQGQTGFVPLTVNNSTPPPPTEPDLIGLEADLTAGVPNIDLASLLNGNPLSGASVPDVLANLLHVQVNGLYSDGSKKDVTDLATLSCDDVEVNPLVPCALGIDGMGTGQVVGLLLQGLLNQDSYVNVKYGGYTAKVNVKLDLPALTQLGFPSGTITVANNNQLPPLTALLSDGVDSTIDANLPGVTYALTAGGPVTALYGVPVVGPILENLVNTVLGGTSIVNGVLQQTPAAETALNQVLNNTLFQTLGISSPLNLTATLDGVTSAPATLVVGQP
jgi:hypothetical protein